MKFIHTSDLHIGKMLAGYSLEAGQKAFFSWLAGKAGEIHPDAIVVAGDIFDRAAPSSNALALFNEVLRQDFGGTPVLAIAGNHDSAELLNLAQAGKDTASTRSARGWTLRTSLCAGGSASPFVPVEIGNTDVWLLPWFTSADVRMLAGSGERMSAREAMELVLARIRSAFRSGRRNLLVSHAMVGSFEPSHSGSESIVVGTAESVPPSLFEGFDAVALGHIHSCQCCGNPRIAYSGSPLAYSVDEAGTDKFIRVTEIADDGAVASELIRVEPLNPLVRLTGRLEDLCRPAFAAPYRSSFVEVVLTDETAPMEPHARLASAYPLLLVFRLAGTVAGQRLAARAEFAQRIRTSPLSVFEDFWQARGQGDLSECERSLVAEAIRLAQQNPSGGAAQ